MTDLVAFLNARLDETEAEARAISGNTVIGEPGNWQRSPAGDRWAPSRTDCEVELLVALRPDAPRTPDGLADLSTGHYGQIAIWSDEGDIDLDGMALPLARFIARHDPARVLADVAAKRAIVAAYENALQWHEARHPSVPDDQSGLFEEVEALRGVVKHLANIHADHPDFDDAWRIQVSPDTSGEHHH